MTELAREYGEGLYALAAEEKLEEQLLDELRVVKECFRAEPDFPRLLSNMSLGKEERLSILDHALRSQVNGYLLNFLKLLCERGAVGELSGCEEAYRALYNRDHNIVEAKVTSGAKLTDDQRKRLTDKLCKMTGKHVVLQERVDSSVMGGVVLEMDGKRYDNTVAGRLASLRRILAGQD